MNRMYFSLFCLFSFSVYGMDVEVLVDPALNEEMSWIQEDVDKEQELNRAKKKSSLDLLRRYAKQFKKTHSHRDILRYCCAHNAISPKSRKRKGNTESIEQLNVEMFSHVVRRSVFFPGASTHSNSSFIMPCAQRLGWYNPHFVEGTFVYYCSTSPLKVMQNTDHKLNENENNDQDF